MNHISFPGPLVSCSFKNLRRFLSASLTLSLSFVLLSGCGFSVQPLIVSSPDQPITLNVCVWEDEKTYMTAVADAYNAVSANVTVQITPLSSDNYEQNMNGILQDTNSYDLVGIKGIAKVVQLANENLLLDITDSVKDCISDNSIDLSSYGNMFNDITYNDHYYAIPTRTTCWALFYNKDLFDQAELPYPQQMTWNEYEALAQKLTNSKDNIYGGYFLPWLPNFRALQKGTYLIDDDTSELSQSLEFLNRLYSSSHISYYEMEEVENPPEDVYRIFESGKVAMVPNGEWMANLLLQDEAAGLSHVNWDIAPMPVENMHDAGTTWGHYQYMCISASSKHPAEAFDFLMYLCGSSGAAIYANHAIIPAYSDAQIIEAYRKAVQHDSTQYFFEAKKIQEQLPILGYQEAIEAYNAAAKSYFSGTLTLDEAMHQFEEDRTSIFRPSR